MIAKRIELRNQQMSSFARLVNYITGTQEKHERVGTIRVTNCQSEVPAWAALEAEAVQANNTRTRMDKTYHLLISFREGDNPSEETIQAIEDRICETLGYGEHQRVSAVHYDTDHMHIHLAINKIHPTRFTAHEPYFDKRALGTLCETFEREYGIAADNHIPRMTPGEAKAQDMEKSAGVESLIGWIKRGVLPELLISTSWQEMHAVLAKNGLTMAERGNGLVMVDRNGIGAKASSVARPLSKVALEKRLGPFQASKAHDRQVTARYEVKPVVSSVDTAALWALYQREQLQQKQRYAVLSERAKERKTRRINTAKKTATLKRSVIKLTKGRTAKSILYHTTSRSFMSEMESIHKDYRQDRQQIFAKGRVAWYDWLKVKAGEGNTEALEVLRRRYEREARGNALAGKNVRSGKTTGTERLKVDTITKRGTIHYQIAKTVLRDEGNRFRLADGLDADVLTPALHLAIQRFGSQLTVQGTEHFRAQIIDIAAHAKLKVTFADPQMEEQRQQRMALDKPQSVDGSSEDAVSRYVIERNQTRAKGIDVLPHRPYEKADAGTFVFAGMRHLEDKTFILLQTSSEVLVMPVDEKTVQRLGRLKIGSGLEVKRNGFVHGRGRRQ